MGSDIRRPGGRLLNEFLVSLGLFFLMLTAGLVILGSASESSSQATATGEATSLARETMEVMIATASPNRPTLRQESFVGPESGVTFNRVSRLTPLSGDKARLAMLSVVVDWEGGKRKVRLERYVSRI